MKTITYKILPVAFAALIMSGSAVDAGSFREKAHKFVDKAAKVIDEKVVPVSSKAFEDATDFTKKQAKSVGKHASEFYKKSVVPNFDKAEKATRNYIEKAIAEHKAKKDAASNATEASYEIDVAQMTAYCEALSFESIGTEKAQESSCTKMLSLLGF